MVSKAAFAFDMAADEAGRAFGEIRSAFGIETIEQLKAVGDTINYLSNTMGANAAQIVDILRRAGAAAKQFGLDAKSVAVFGAVLKEQGFSTEVIGTGLSTVLQRLQMLNEQAREALNIIGMTAEEFQELKRKSPEEALIKLLEGIKRLDKETQAQVLYKLFGLEHSDEMAGLLNNLDRLKQKLSEIRAGKYTGSMDEEVKKLMQTTWAQFQVLKNQLQNLAIAIGSLLIPPLKTFVELLASAVKPITDFIQAHQTLAKVLVYPVVGIGLLLTALGSLAVAVGWIGRNFIDGAKFILDWTTKLKTSALWARITAFATMPLGEQLKLLNTRLKALALLSWSSLKNLHGWIKSLTLAFWRANIAVVKFTVATLRLQTVEQVKGALTALITVIGNLRKAIWSFIVTNPYLLAFAGIALFIYKFWSPIKAFFSGFFEGLKEGFAEAFAPLKPILSPIINAVKILFGWIGKILKPLDDTEGKFQNIALAGKALGYAISKLIVLFAKLAIPIVNIISIFTQLGSAIVDGLVKGIKKAATKPVEAIKEVGKGILNGFKSLLGISSPSKLFMQFGHFLNEGLGLRLLKSLGLVKSAIGKVASLLHLPKITPQVSIPKLAFEGLKALTLPVTLVASLLSPISALSLPVKQVEKRESTKLERIVQVEKILQAERVLRERFSSEKLVRERTFEKTPVLPSINVQVTINNLTVGNREDVPAVAKEIAGITKAELWRMLKELYEELDRKRY